MSAGYWPETTGSPGRDWASYMREGDAESLAGEMFVPKQAAVKHVAVQGFTYDVANTGTSEDEEIALTLHELNEFAIAVINYTGRFASAAIDGQADAGDFDIPRLVMMHERMRKRYNVDRMFEAVEDSDASRESGGTSYVLNLGEEIHMCVRSNGKRDKMVVLYTVMTHELAHVSCSTTVHDEEFWENYQILRAIVVQMGVVKEADIPADGGTHCQKIRINRSEMLSIASPFRAQMVPTGSSDGAGYVISPGGAGYVTSPARTGYMPAIDVPGLNPGILPTRQQAMLYQQQLAEQLADQQALQQAILSTPVAQQLPSLTTKLSASQKAAARRAVARPKKTQHYTPIQETDLGDALQTGVVRTSSYAPLSIPMRSDYSEEVDSIHTTQPLQRQVNEAFYSQHRSPFTGAGVPSFGGSARSCGCGHSEEGAIDPRGHRDVLGEFDWRYGSFEREQPGPYMAMMSRPDCVGTSGQYSRRSYAMGHLSVNRGESLNTVIEFDT